MKIRATGIPPSTGGRGIQTLEKDVCSAASNTTERREGRSGEKLFVRALRDEDL